MSHFELPEFPSELTLVIACARWPFGERDEQEIQQRALAPVDWDRFLACVHRNQIAPLVNRNLRRAAVPAVPATVIAQLRKDAAHNVRRILKQIAELNRVARLLAQAGIRSLVIKGPVLSVLAFGDPALRQSVDVDLLVDPEMALEADRSIVQAGYLRVSPNFELTPTRYEAYRRFRNQFAYYSRSLDLVLELHWRLSSNLHLLPLEATTLWSRPERVRVAGTYVATLPDEELFLYLCVHGSMHMWLRLKWLADIAALLHEMPLDVIDRIAVRARSFEVERPFHQALLLANRLMAAPVPPHILSSARRDNTARRLATAACQALTWSESPTDALDSPWFSTWANWHAYRLKSGFRFRWAEFQYQMCSPEDWEWLPLPERLFFLYIPVRPFSWAVRKLRRIAGA
jgi:Uncharacterised nucleotidyltransferase